MPETPSIRIIESGAGTQEVIRNCPGLLSGDIASRFPVPSLVQHSGNFSPNPKGRLSASLALIFSKRIGGVTAPREVYVQDLGFTWIRRGDELSVNTSSLYFEVLRGLARILDDERSFSWPQLRWHVDTIVSDRDVDSARILVGSDGIGHGIDGFLRASSHSVGRFFCPAHGRMGDVLGRVNNLR